MLTEVRCEKFREKSISFHTAAGFKSGLSSAYSNLGSSYSALGFLDRSAEYHLKSYRIKEELEDKLGMTLSLYNLSNCF